MKFKVKQIKTIYLDLDGVLVSLYEGIGIVLNIKEFLPKLKFAEVVGKKEEQFKSVFNKAIEAKCFEFAPPTPLYYFLTVPSCSLNNLSILEYWKTLDISVEILSSITSHPEYQETIQIQKINWLKGKQLDYLPLHLVKGSSLKQQYIKSCIDTTSLLLDDYKTTIQQYVSNGGYAIHIKDTRNFDYLIERLIFLNLLPKNFI